MEREEVQYWVLKALQYQKYGDERLQEHLAWCVENGYEEEAEGYRIVLSGNYAEYLTCEHEGHKVEYVDGGCLKIDGRYIKIKEDDYWAYKVQKTQIKALGGALRFMQHYFVKRWWWQGFGRHLCEAVAKVKEYKAAKEGAAA